MSGYDDNSALLKLGGRTALYRVACIRHTGDVRLQKISIPTPKKVTENSERERGLKSQRQNEIKESMNFLAEGFKPKSLH